LFGYMFSGDVLYKVTPTNKSKQETGRLKKQVLPEQKASPGEHFAHRAVEAPGGVGFPKIYQLSI
jgi:hypothetical protein